MCSRTVADSGQTSDTDHQLSPSAVTCLAGTWIQNPEGIFWWTIILWKYFLPYKLLLLFSNTDSDTKVESQTDKLIIIQFSPENTIVKQAICDTLWSQWNNIRD